MTQILRQTPPEVVHNPWTEGQGVRKQRDVNSEFLLDRERLQFLFARLRIGREPTICLLLP